jgi:hypothetical protein
MNTRTQEHIRSETTDRFLAQRMAALGNANEVRTYRANLKRDIKAGRALVHNLLLEPPELIETMKLFDLMLAMPKYGRTKINKILQQCRISPAKRVGELSVRQRTEIVSMLRH